MKNSKKNEIIFHYFQQQRACFEVHFENSDFELQRRKLTSLKVLKKY